MLDAYQRIEMSEMMYVMSRPCLLALISALLGCNLAMAQSRREQERRPRPISVVEVLDLDRDGEISAEELARAGASLKKLDRNGDGRLDRDELRVESSRTRSRERRSSKESSSTELAAPPQTLVAGVHRIGIEHEGKTRGMIIHVPADYDSAKSYPVVFGFHGAGGPMEGFHRRLSPLVERGEIISVSPQGLGENPRGVTGFNAFPRCTLTKADDVGLVKKVVAYLQKSASIDNSRCYATGGSNGGIFCYRLALETDLFAAIAPLRAGMLHRHPLPEARPHLSIFHAHGTEDEALPFEGGRAARDEVFHSARQTLALWAKNHGVKVDPVSEHLADEIELVRYARGKDPFELTLCILEGEGHRLGRETVSKVDAMVWEFLRRQRKAPRSVRDGR
jgi:polyhydroxybutyrate depolymerase